MIVKAWMQTGVERRQTIIDIPNEELHEVLRVEGTLERAPEGYVLEWVNSQYGWGWSGGGMELDFASCEGASSAGWQVIEESALPNSKALSYGAEIQSPLN